MALEQTKIWKCDMCEKKVVLHGGEPSSWEINVKITCNVREAYADFCRECYKTSFPDCAWDEGKRKSSLKDGEFKKPFWRTFWSNKL